MSLLGDDESAFDNLSDAKVEELFGQFSEAEIQELLDLGVDLVQQATNRDVPQWQRQQRSHVLSVGDKVQQLEIRDPEISEDDEAFIIALDYYSVSLGDCR